MWNNQNNNYQPSWRGQPVYSGATTLDRSSLIQKVMWFTTTSIVAAAGGVWLGVNGLHSAYNMSRGSSILWIIAEIGFMIGAMVLRERTPINFILLYGFALSSGVLLAPTMQILSDAGYSGIIVQALLVTGALTFALGIYAWTTKRDFSGLAPYLFVAVIGLLIVSMLNIFLHSTMLYSIIMYAGVMIFSFYLIFDVQQAKKSQNTIGNAIALSIGIYLDILNLFLFILQILMSLQGRD
ncbi:MAG: Bax inhibitor-1/YccA family protein [Chloroflexi bacterium]|uniref:Bax inhibitor-1/YccA family protein n=1 Tax=Candidatus Chlorohelix allophototropha TaxID=3003348 RepID=A0A8T7M1X8_9CHLR|nr:Bax inhibitor-1/YccA family protein [Chloroflexota bacterium]WJW65538.1 Bax inhibitor-1/YccA family protein [Chloroflexota bacterium L227-S17]